MPQLPDVNKKRHAASHHGIAFIRVIALPAIVRQHNPIGMMAYYRDEIRVGNGGWEVGAVALYAIARLFKRVGNELPQIAVSKEGELMLRLRKLVLPLTQPGRARSPL